eukprot:UN27568
MGNLKSQGTVHFVPGNLNSNTAALPPPPKKIRIKTLLKQSVDLFPSIIHPIFQQRTTTKNKLNLLNHIVHLITPKG